MNELVKGMCAGICYMLLMCQSCASLSCIIVNESNLRSVLSDTTSNSFRRAPTMRTCMVLYPVDALVGIGPSENISAFDKTITMDIEHESESRAC